MDSEEEELFFSDEGSEEEQEEGSDFSGGDDVAAVESEEGESEADFESDDVRPVPVFPSRFATPLLAILAGLPRESAKEKGGS